MPDAWSRQFVKDPVAEARAPNRFGECKKAPRPRRWLALRNVIAAVQGRRVWICSRSGDAARPMGCVSSKRLLHCIVASTC